MRSQEDEAGLMALLRDERSTDDDRLLAARFLGALGCEAAVPILAMALADTAEDEGVRIAAARSLGWLNAASAADSLLSVASAASESEVLKHWALDSLAMIGDQRAAPFLINVLDGESDRHQRRWAARGLGRIGAPIALEPLRRARHRDPLRRWLYSWAITQCEDGSRR